MHNTVITENSGWAPLATMPAPLWLCPAQGAGPSRFSESRGLLPTSQCLLGRKVVLFCFVLKCPFEIKNKNQSVRRPAGGRGQYAPSSKPCLVLDKRRRLATGARGFRWWWAQGRGQESQASRVKGGQMCVATEGGQVGTGGGVRLRWPRGTGQASVPRHPSSGLDYTSPS